MRSGKELEEVEKEPRKVVDKGKQVVEENPKEDDTESSKPALKVKAYKPTVPFLARLKQHAPDKQFAKFLEVLRNRVSIYILLIL